jgi:hypothetical protein
MATNSEVHDKGLQEDATWEEYKLYFSIQLIIDYLTASLIIFSFQIRHIKQRERIIYTKRNFLGLSFFD